MSDQTTWEEGPWLVEVKYTYVVGGCSSETARRAANADASGRDLLKHDESWPPLLDRRSVTSTVHPLHGEPFDIDTTIKEIQGE